MLAQFFYLYLQKQYLWLLGQRTGQVFGWQLSRTRGRCFAFSFPKRRREGGVAGEEKGSGRTNNFLNQRRAFCKKTASTLRKRSNYKRENKEYSWIHLSPALQNCKNNLSPSFKSASKFGQFILLNTSKILQRCSEHKQAGIMLIAMCVLKSGQFIYTYLYILLISIHIFQGHPYSGVFMFFLLQGLLSCYYYCYLLFIICAIHFFAVVCSCNLVNFRTVELIKDCLILTKYKIIDQSV